LPEILASLHIPHTTFTADSSILAPTAVDIDIVGKLTTAQGNYTLAIAAVEYFIKWVEAKPVTNITSTTI
jgi:hypothetical protein